MLLVLKHLTVNKLFKYGNSNLKSTTFKKWLVYKYMYVDEYILLLQTV